MAHIPAHIPAPILALFDAVEEAIDARDDMRRLTENPMLSGPSLEINRHGYTMRIHVKVGRMRPDPIFANGETAEEAGWGEGRCRCSPAQPAKFG